MGVFSSDAEYCPISGVLLTFRRPAVLVVALALSCGALAASSAAMAQAKPASTKPAAAKLARPPAGVLGIDVSSWQPHVRWKIVKTDHLRFAYIKATEGTYYQSPTFRSQYRGARGAGIVAGAYHFATPDTSSGAAQARYFAAHGGGWRAGALPGVLDIEGNPYGRRCYGLTPAAMTGWIRVFVRTYHARTGWWPVINTFTSWWKACTGNTLVFAARDPLWVNAHGRTASPLPAGWTSYTVWQWAETGTYPADQDVIPARLFSRLHHEPR
jgi:GH25 family lysozyme M1 (1,4-beta-N-acetylmuramidase)